MFRGHFGPLSRTPSLARAVCSRVRRTTSRHSRGGGQTHFCHRHLHRHHLRHQHLTRRPALRSPSAHRRPAAGQSPSPTCASGNRDRAVSPSSRNLGCWSLAADPTDHGAMVTTRDPAPDEWDADFASDSDSRPLVLAAASHSPDRTREGPSPTWRQRYPHDRSSSDSSWPSSFFSSLPRSEGAADEQQDCSLSQGSSSPRHLGPLSAGAGVQERSLALPRISTKVDGAQHRAPAFGSSSHRTHSRPPTHPASASSLDLAAGTRLGSVHTASASSSVGQRSGTGSVLEPDTGVRPDRGLPSPSLPLSPMQISQPFESSPLPTSFTLSSQHCTPGISEKSSGPRISLSGRSLPSRSRPASPTSSQHISRQRPSSELHIPAHIRAAQARIRNDNYLVKQFAAGILGTCVFFIPAILISPLVALCACFLLSLFPPIIFLADPLRP